MNEKSKSNSYGKMVIDDGTVEEKIYNKFGEVIGTFRFRPTDIDIFNRFDEVADKFEEILKPLEETSVNSDGTPADDDYETNLETLNNVRDEVCKAVDYIFGESTSEAFFGKIHPFSVINGSFYCENALEMLGNYISNAFNVETKRFDKRYDRYTQNYHKKSRSKYKNYNRKGNK